jgi:hypothetical protein
MHQRHVLAVVRQPPTRYFELRPAPPFDERSARGGAHGRRIELITLGAASEPVGAGTAVTR